MPTRTRPHARPAFTLIELLVVLGIIALLVSITLLVGRQVKVSSETRFTQDTIRVLDNVMDAYIHATGEIPPPTYTPAAGSPTFTGLAANTILLAADARDMTNTNAISPIGPTGPQMLDGMSVFFAQASEVPAAKDILTKIPSRATSQFDPDGNKPQPLAITVLDAWKRPIRYVHPAFQGDVVGSLRVNASVPNAPRPVAEMFGTPAAGQSYICTDIRRNHVGTTTTSGPSLLADALADSDGGTCPGTRPYFYSAGPDGLVGLGANAQGTVQDNFNLDNVYTTMPKLPSQ